MSSLPDKLYNQQQTPPHGVWDKIAAALDEAHIGDEFPARLYNAEATPPSHAWDKIADALEPAHASVVPMQSKSFSFFRYAAAAVVIGLVAFGVVKFMNRNNDNVENAVAGNKAKKERDSTDIKTLVNPPVENNIPDIVENTTEPTNTKNEPAPVAKKTKTRHSVPDDAYAEPEPVYAYNEHTPNLADRYIMYMTPDGGIVRMSKKWGNLVCCVSGQDQDEDCKDQIKKWQEKLACAPVANGNFMDILSLVNTLNTDL
jgi:hypothetical protein